MSKYRLKGLILMYGYDLKSFSESSGIQYDHLKKITKSDARVTLDDVTRICRTLKITPLIFFPHDVTNYHLDNNAVSIQNAINMKKEECTDG